MILNIDDIKRILTENPNKDLVQNAKKYNKALRTHFYGEDLKGVLRKIDDFETDVLHKLRIQYATANKDLFNRLSRPMDKVYTARGGSVYYNLPEAGERKARQLLSDIGGGISLKKWMETNWMQHYKDDPAGLIFMEIKPNPEAARLQSQGKSFVYPTYKSIQTVFDYLVNGQTVEYVVFSLDKKDLKAMGITEEGQYYRVVDDSADYIVKRQSGVNTLKNGTEVISEFAIIEELTLPNYFTQVPAILCGNIPDTEHNQGVISIFDPIIEQANKFLVKGSIKVTHDFMHGFPKYWEYANDCDKCEGTGWVEAQQCPECKGSGHRPMTKVSDVHLLNLPQDKNDATITPHVGGYIEPSINFHEIAVADLSMLEDIMAYTIWGMVPKIQTNGMSVSKDGQTKTATEALTDIKPQADRLLTISSYAEKVHKFCMDSIIRLQIDINYSGASVNYGTRYMLESPEALWDKYQKAKSSGASDTALDAMLVEYYESVYFNDPIELAIKVKLMKVEPNIHRTIEQVKALGYDEDYLKRKMYFGDWKRTLTQAMLISFTSDQLNDQLSAYVSGITLPEPEEQKRLTA